MNNTHQPCDECGSSDALTSYHNGTKCFSCGKFKKVRPHKKKEVVYETNQELPNLQQLNKEQMKFLRSKGITYTLQIKYELASESLSGRIFIPSNRRGVIVGYQGRGYNDSHQVKYIQKKGMCPKLFFSKSADTERKIPYVVLVEDAFSAMVVGEVAPCIALCGTSLDSRGEKLNMLTQVTDKFILWLDSDVAGKDAVKKLRKQLSIVGEVLKVVRTTKDPKYHTTKKIEELLL